MGTKLDQRAARAVGDADDLAVVDRALGMVGGRSFFTAAEARGLLEEVAEGSTDIAHAEQVALLVRNAFEGIGDALLVDRSRLIDPLLDIRLALRD